MSVIGELLVEINGDNSGLKKSLGDSGNAVTAGIGKMVSAIGLASVAWKAVDLAMKGIDYNKAAEQAEIAFGSFLGSASAAKDMIENLRDLAKETPLEFAEVRDAAKQLSAFGISAQNLVPTMRMLADVSAGLNIPVKDLSYLYGTIQVQQKAMTVDIQQFANRGIPIWEELSRITGKSGAELRKMVEAGQIGFPQIEEAFKNMTGEGGKFFNMAVKQMDSLAGSQSNLNDAIDTWLGHVTEGLTGPLKDMNKAGADILNGWVEIDKQWFIVNSQLNAMRDHFFGIKRTQQEIRDDAFVMVQTWDQMTARGKAYLDNQAKLAEEEKKRKEAAAKALEDANARNAVEQEIKQEYSNQLGLIANIIASSQDLATLEEIRLEEQANGIKDVYAKQLDYIAGVVQASKDQAEEREDAESKEATARQIVLGYQNAAIAKQILANELEETYVDTVEAAAEKQARIAKAVEGLQGGVKVLGALFKKLGDDDMASMLDNIVSAGVNVGKLFASGGADIGAWVGLATTAIDTVGDTVLGWFGIETGAQKKAREEREKAEREYAAARAKAAAELNQKYEDYGKSQAEIAKSNFDKEMAYAVAIGASAKTIDAIKQSYYESEAERIEDNRKAELDAANKQKELMEKRSEDLSDFMDEYNKASEDRLVLIQEEETAALKTAESLGASYEDRLAIQSSYAEKLSDAFNSRQKEIQDAQLAYQEKVTKDIEDQKAIAEKARQDISDSYSNAGKSISSLMISGMDNGDNIQKFRESFLTMMKRMAIEATVMSEQFKGKFEDIGKLITTALSDGIFTEKELGQIDIKTSALFQETSKTTSLINDLFNRASLSDTLVATDSRNLAQTTVNVYTTSDPITIANAVSNVQQSLAYQGVVA